MISLTNILVTLCAATLPAGNISVNQNRMFADTAVNNIRLNQEGFYPDAPKIAVVLQAPAGAFLLRNVSSNTVAFKGSLGESLRSTYSGKESRVADFSQMRDTGSFVLEVPGIGISYPFAIRRDVHAPLAKAALKGFWYQRAGTALPASYAGPWSRAEGHPDTIVLVHASAAGPVRVAGNVISSPGGWYDAGDYNKYIVNSGITMATLLSLCEDFPVQPEVQDEALWNLRWMLTMQDPDDGGVYHKLTNASFDGMVMPHAANKPRYVVQKSTAATLDFAAVMAQAARVYHLQPALADSCVKAAEKAWAWAMKHPDIYYEQDKMNIQFDPDISTGAYGDKDVSDEFVWAASELFITTRKPAYYAAIQLNNVKPFQVPSWAQVRTLGYYSLIRFEKMLREEDRQALRAKLNAFAEDLVKDVSRQPYQTVMGRTARDFVWGSSAVAANQGIALLQAYRISGNIVYLHHALGNLDYLLGRNATGYSFVTGIGTKTPMHIHHRPSQADGVAAPVPGLLSGGPNPGKQDGCTYASSAADEAFTDDVCSYASNEIAINWNAPLVYLAVALEALQK